MRRAQGALGVMFALGVTISMGVGAASARADAAHPLVEGGSASDFELPRALPGTVGTPKPLKLSSLRGKVVLVDLWATWCEPCKRELPELVKLRREYGPRGFEIVAVALDESPGTVAKFLRERSLTELPVVVDPAQAVPARWQPSKMPTSYVLDRQGIIRLRLEGYEPSAIPRLRAVLDKLLARPSR